MLFGFHFGQQTETRLHIVSETLFPAAMKSRHALMTFNEQRKLYYDSVLLGESSFIDIAHNKSEEIQSDFLAIIELEGLENKKTKIANTLLKDLSEYTASAQIIYPTLVTYVEDTLEINDETMRKNKEKARNLNNVGAQLHSRMSTFADSFAEDLQKEISAIDKTTRQQRYMNMVIFFAVVIVALSLISIIISRSIVRPLKKTFMLENAVKQSIDGMIVFDQKGNVTFYNIAWAQMFGFQTEELHDIHMRIFHTEDQLENDVEHFKESLANSGGYSGEMGFKQKNGLIFPALVTASTLKDETGKSLNTLMIAKDITEEKKAEEELIRINQAVEGSSDAIGISNSNKNHFYQNKSFTKMFGYEKDEFNSGLHPTDLYADEQVKNEILDSVLNNMLWSGEIEIVQKNGHLLPVLLRAEVIKDNEGQTIGFVGIYTDITKRKKAEAELAAAQKELVEKAHQAGMADIATGTLHNVGNILNSVKTSGQIILEVLGVSSIDGLKKANDMLRENMDHLDEFIIKDPMGKKLMQYYLKLEDEFTSEHSTTKKHVTRLNNKVNAIAEVIAAQQSYAGAGGLSEKHSLSEIVEDALTMQFGTTGRYDINIIKDFHSIPNIFLQRTKLIHILINLIKNSTESILESGADEKTLTFSIYSDGEGIFLKMSDTGFGIEKGNLEKIFSHGFTTKKTGHGFGLHSSANYMKEMGGRMWAESEGEGKGATFILRFPHPDAG